MSINKNKMRNKTSLFFFLYLDGCFRYCFTSKINEVRKRIPTNTKQINNEILIRLNDETKCCFRRDGEYS